jgi:hypothetical protein
VSLLLLLLLIKRFFETFATNTRCGEQQHHDVKYSKYVEAAARKILLPAGIVFITMPARERHHKSGRRTQKIQKPIVTEILDHKRYSTVHYQSGCYCCYSTKTVLTHITPKILIVYALSLFCLKKKAITSVVAVIISHTHTQATTK